MYNCLSVQEIDFSSLSSDFSFRDTIVICHSAGNTNLSQNVHGVVLGRWSEKFSSALSENQSKKVVTVR